MLYEASWGFSILFSKSKRKMLYEKFCIIPAFKDSDLVLAINITSTLLRLLTDLDELLSSASPNFIQGPRYRGAGVAMVPHFLRSK